MRILKKAVAGTLESSDVLVEVEPGCGEIEIEIDSIVKNQFGDQIENVVRMVLKKFDVTDIVVYINDKGALDCTIQARTETAILRAGNEVND